MVTPSAAVSTRPSRRSLAAYARVSSATAGDVQRVHGNAHGRQPAHRMGDGAAGAVGQFPGRRGPEGGRRVRGGQLAGAWKIGPPPAARRLVQAAARVDEQRPPADRLERDVRGADVLGDLIGRQPGQDDRGLSVGPFLSWWS